MVSKKSLFKNKRTNSLKNLRSSVKKIKKVELSIAQAVVIRRTGKIRLVEEEEPFFPIQNLCQVHLDLVMEKIRSNKNWNHISERLLCVSVYMMLKLSVISRIKIDEMLILLGTLRCETAHNYASMFINGHEDFLTDENRGKYHRPSIFDYLPDLKDD